jgi:exonuclease III
MIKKNTDELKIRTWNMNYWKDRKGRNEKTTTQKDEWIKFAKNIIFNGEYFDFIVLQEASLNILRDEKVIFNGINGNNIINVDYDDNKIIYHTNPKKYLDWGIMVISKKHEGICNRYDNSLAYMCYDFIIANETITIVNFHSQQDFSSKLYYPTLKKFINEIRQIKEEKNNQPIFLVGDFNASDKFYSSEIENFKIVFEEIKNIGFFDCTEKICLDDRSTMLDYPFQNDYIFINEPFDEKDFKINIRKDIETEYIDHYPIDIKINL